MKDPSMNGYTNQIAAPRSVRILALAATLVASAARADVTTTLTESWLVVHGDGGPDAIDITEAEDGVVVTGLGGTRVDGSTDAITIPGVQRLTVRFARGSDYVKVHDLGLSGSMDLRLGRGNDDVLISGVQAGATRIQTGPGEDWVRLTDSRFKSLWVDTADDGDTIDVQDVSVPGDMTVHAGDDDDDVAIAETDVGTDVEIELGDGDDMLEIEDVVFDADTDLDGGDGDDDLTMSDDSSFDGDVDVEGFAGSWSFWSSPESR